jgi:DNA polymerase III epsilon subunit-like protein
MNHNKKQKIYLCLDVETGGQMLGIHPLLQIGMVAMNDQEQIIIKKDYYFQPPNYNPDDGKEGFTKSFDVDCLNNFWLKQNKTLLDTIYKEAKPIKDSINQFIHDFEKLDSVYTLVIVCDNPALDYSFINYYMSIYGNHQPLHIDQHNDFRPIYDTRSYAMGAIRKEFDNYNISAKQTAYLLEFDLPSNKNKHNASSDAEYTLKMFIRTMTHLLARQYTTETRLHWF